MNFYKYKIIGILKLYIGLFFSFAIIRSIFLFANINNFPSLTFSKLFWIEVYGARFDWFTISALNILFVFLFILPFKFTLTRYYLTICNAIFLLLNGIGFLFEFIDFAFFQFTHRRSTIGIFDLLFRAQTDIVTLLPHFVSTYWYFVVLFALSILYLNWLFNRIYVKGDISIPKLSKKNIIFQCILILSILLIFILGIRGGLQRIPIVILDASKQGYNQYDQAILNTTFCILKSFELEQLEKVNDIPDGLSKKYFNPIREYASTGSENCNVCIIILESFSKEFTGLGHRKNYTPFLDSLMQNSLTFSNAYANGKTSIEAIPSIIASMPSFMQRPYINSEYSNNRIDALPILLKKKGYHSTFFHGGTNGTMNFNSFAAIAGFDEYFGRTEYADEKDYDGSWGIWDHKFLPRVVDEITKIKEPFFTAIFTLSSHDPFKVPLAFNNKFPKGNQNIIQSIGYTDYSLRLFFNKAKKEAWYKNTLFVITADHTSASNDPYYANTIGQYSIPLLLFKNNELRGTNNKAVQQIDIMPTVLDYLNYELPFYSLGSSMLNNQSVPVIFYPNPNYYVVNDSNISVYTGNKIAETYNYHRDSMMFNPISIKKSKKLDEEMFIRSFLQRYNNDILNNCTHYQQN